MNTPNNPLYLLLFGFFLLLFSCSSQPGTPTSQPPSGNPTGEPSITAPSVSKTVCFKTLTYKYEAEGKTYTCVIVVEAKEEGLEIVSDDELTESLQLAMDNAGKAGCKGLCQKFAQIAECDCGSNGQTVTMNCLKLMNIMPGIGTVCVDPIIIDDEYLDFTLLKSFHKNPDNLDHLREVMGEPDAKIILPTVAYDQYNEPIDLAVELPAMDTE